MRFIDLCSGIGGFRLAGERLGWTCVWGADICPHANSVYARHFGKTPAGRDLTAVDPCAIPQFDILCAGFPCQPYSQAGSKHGLADKRAGVFSAICRILEARRPLGFVLENVPNLPRLNGGADFAEVLRALDTAGYTVGHAILNANNYGLAQDRKRLFIVGARKDSCKRSEVEIPAPFRRTTIVNDILEPEVDEECYVSHEVVFSKAEDTTTRVRRPVRIGVIPPGWQGNRVYSIYGNTITLTAEAGGFGGKTGLYLVDGKVRKLSVRECLRAQGFPDTFEVENEEVSRAKAYKLIGNSVPVPLVVIAARTLLQKLGE